MDRRFSPTPTLAWLAVLFVAVASGPALAQEHNVIGSIGGTVDDEPFELLVYEGSTGDQSLSGAYWNSWSDGMLDVTIIGQTRPSLVSFTPGAMLIDFTVLGDLQACPCPVENPSIFFSPDGGFTQNVYDDLESEATVTEVVEIEPGVYRIAGTARGTLGLKEGIMDRPDPERTVVVEVTFVIERLAEEVE